MVLVNTKQTLGYLLSWGTCVSPSRETARIQRERVAVTGTAHAGTFDVPTFPSASSGRVT